MAELLLTDELALCGLQPDGSVPAAPRRTWIGMGLTALFLHELEVRDRISIDNDDITLIDPARTDDPLLDAILDVTIAHRPKLPNVINRGSVETRGLLDQVGASLVERGLATPRIEGRLVKRTTGWIPDPATREAIIDRLRAAVLDGAQTMDDRTALVVALVADCGMASLVLPDGELHDIGVAVVRRAGDRNALTRLVRHLVRTDAERSGYLEQ